MYVCMYECMYVCMYFPEIQPKRYMIAQTFLAHLTHHFPAVCSIKFRSNWATKKIIQKSIPDSVKYSSGEFDQCKQPRRYSSLELSFFSFLLEMIFFINRWHNGNPMGSRVVSYALKVLFWFSTSKGQHISGHDILWLGMLVWGIITFTTEGRRRLCFHPCLSIYWVVARLPLFSGFPSVCLFVCMSWTALEARGVTQF